MLHEYLIESVVPTHYRYRVHAESLNKALAMVENDEVLASSKDPDYDDANIYCTHIDGKLFTPFLRAQ